MLVVGSRPGVFGSPLCEAAIQSVHAGRTVRSFTDHAALRLLYDPMVARVPTPGARVARAAALAEAGDAGTARAALEEAARLAGGDAAVARCQPCWPTHWATPGRVLRMPGDGDGARAATGTAIGLTEDAAVRRFLRTSIA